MSKIRNETHVTKIGDWTLMSKMGNWTLLSKMGDLDTTVENRYQTLVSKSEMGH